MSKARASAASSDQPGLQQDEESSEQTPLLHTHDNSPNVESSDHTAAESPARDSLLQSFTGPASGKGSRLKRWPSLLALVILCVIIVVILVAAFVAPQVVSEYANQAVVFEPTSLSIASFTATGVVAHVQGTFSMDSARVKSKAVRDFGRFGTYIAREIETRPTTVEVSFPEYGSPVVGTANVPAIKVNVQNGHTTAIDFLTQLEPGSKDAIRRVADDWIKGKLGQLRVQGKADVTVRSGILTLPSQRVLQSIVFESHEIPDMPDFDILKLLVHEEELPDGNRGLAADVALRIANDYPVDFTVPPLGFAILVPNCAPTDPYIMLADATTGSLHIEPHQDIGLNVTGTIRRLPKEAVTACPGSYDSPLDLFLANYIHGEKSTVYVRGSDSPSQHTPQWLVDIMRDVTVPVPLPGRTLGHLIKNFTMSDVHFGLPDPFADPDTPEANPKISAIIKALIALPDEFNFNIGVHRVRAMADVYYKKEKFGYLDLHKWNQAQSRPVKTTSEHSDLEVTSKVDEAPLTITDQDVFSSVISELITGSGANLTVKAIVDVEMETALGSLIIREIPAQGTVPVHPFGGHGGQPKIGAGTFAPKVGNLVIANTSLNSLVLDAKVNITNPTKYTATVPYADLHVSVNKTLVGHLTVRNISVTAGNNTNIPVRGVWSPSSFSGPKGEAIGAEFLSQYISGFNTSLTFSTHEGSIPTQPGLGRSLQNLSLTLPMPHLSGPKDPSDDPPDDGHDEKGDGKPHFIRDAIMHLISSTAQFTLASPFAQTTLYITDLNATAMYKGDPVGQILFEDELEVPPGLSSTPRLPVDWDIGGVGYDAVKNALGGTLKLSANAVLSVRIGMYQVGIWYKGGGIGVGVRF